MASSWFDESYYLSAKAAYNNAHAINGLTTWTSASVQASLNGAGMTAEQHYDVYGWTEGLAPNAYYSESQYVASKVAALNAGAVGGKTDWTAADFYASLNGANPFMHYVQYGAYEAGVEPSTGFDDDTYYADKATYNNTNLVDGRSNWTADEVKAIFQANGLTPIGHYELYGATEAFYTPTPVPNPGQTYTLTTGADNIQGGSADITVSGFADTTVGSGQTLTAVDVIKGGSGTADVLNVTVSGTAPASALNGADVSGIETVNVRATIATALDASTAVGATNIVADRGTGTMTVTNLGSSMAYSINGDGATALGAQSATWGNSVGSFTVNIANGVGPSGTTAPAVTLIAAAGTTATINSTGAANKIGALALGTANIVTDATINATTSLTTGAITAGSLKNLTVTGAGSVDLDSTTTALDVTVTKVDATANTGGTKVLLGANSTSFAGGTGDDFVSIDTLIFDSTGTLAGGTGTDTLAIADSTATLFTAAAKANISGFETLQVSSAATETFDFEALTGITALNVNTATSAIVNNIGAATPITVMGDQTTNMTLNVKDATVPTHLSDSLTFTMDKAGTATTTSIVTVANVTSDGLETLNIVSSGVLGNNAAVATDDNTISSLAGLNTSNVSVINLTGASDLTITTGAINRTVNIDGSKATGNLTIDAALNTSATGITGGTGIDTLKGGAAADVLNGGDNTDTLTGGLAGDTINGGAGNDTYVYAAAYTDSLVTSLTSFDTVTITSGDKFDNGATALTAGTYTKGTQSTTAIGSAANLLSALTEVSSAGTTALTANAGYLITISDTGSTYAGTYLVVENGTSMTSVDATDQIIKLSGITGTSSLVASGGDLLVNFS